MTEETLEFFKTNVVYLETIRIKYMENKDKKYWYDMIQLLPSNYNQLRTVTMNYENLANMYHARKNHKLEEWHILCDCIKAMPYAKELMGTEK